MLNKDEFISHRKKLSSYLDDNSILISFAPKEGENKYNPDRNFFYATGINESRDIVVITKFNNVQNEYLFIKPYDPIAEKWVGRGLNKEEAFEISGIKNIYYIDSFNSFIKNLLTDGVNLYLDLFRNEDDDTLSFVETYAGEIKEKYPYVNIRQARDVFKHARTIKSENEIDEIRKAIHITCYGIEALMSNAKSGIYEYQLESYFDQQIKFHGADGYSFDTIAASGINGCCLHYSENNSIIPDNSLILFDLGATNNHYCADISRTFPVNGKFSPRQKEIYNIVLKGQELMFKTMKPGITTRECNQILVKYYEEELMRIGLISRPEDVSKYYFHGVSHHLGLDCHDLCDYTPLKPGSVISNEPGLYIPEEQIGIRIEDDVLITEDGCECLSKEILKSVDDIEEFMRKNNINVK